MAHELAHVHLLGHGRVSSDEEDHELLTDLLTVFLGFGVIGGNAVIREAYWNTAILSGWNMSRQGYMSMPMYGYALAWFARARGEEKPPWAKHLRADVRSAFKKARRFLKVSEADKDSAAWQLDVPRQSPDEPVARDGFAQPEELPASAEENTPQAAQVETTPISASELLMRYAAGERNFPNVDLRRASLRNADLRDANFTGADFQEADLAEANLWQANLSEAILERANLKEADLAKAILNQAELASA
ncbi:MAG TPA: pentapeptide repeat-containing protein, partial [Gemmataceae bacterium]|nr:pentapeptide repeat-containing protein [Gemmataceae bacterium]